MLKKERKTAKKPAIAKRKRVARSPRAHRNAPLKAEEIFRSAMESASIGMALVDTSGRWIKINPALCDLLGYHEFELMVGDLHAVTHPEDRDRDAQQAERLLAGDTRHYQVEKRYYHKDGHVIWGLVSVSLVRRGNDMPNYFIVQIQDITKQKEAERIKEEFIAIVSHELRTPLSSIRGSLSLIEGRHADELPPKVAKLIGIAHKNCERLIHLINDILDIDKIAAGQMRFDMKAESVADIVAHAVQENQAYADKLQVHIVAAPVDSTLRVSVDASRLLQVLANLLSNAAKFSPAGSDVQVTTQAGPAHVRISVKDNGPGIPDEFRTRIFGKFSQADSADNRPKSGTGLGLHITKQLVESMKGSIGFESETGKGTTFWVEFPLLSTEDQAIDALLHYRRRQTSLPLVLHVEDDTDLSNVLATALFDKAEVITATSLRQALQYLKEQQFALIVLDIGLPDGSGLDLLHDLKHLTPNPPPVLVLSADALSEESQALVAASMVKSRVSETKIARTIADLIATARSVDTR